jgi:hypothetical protein
MTPANLSPPSPALVGDLEMKINTERTLDLFTMMPKVSTLSRIFETELMSRNVNYK